MRDEFQPSKDEENLKEILQLTEEILNNILKSGDYFPNELKFICHYLAEAVGKVYGDQQKALGFFFSSFTNAIKNFLKKELGL